MFGFHDRIFRTALNRNWPHVTLVPVLLCVHYSSAAAAAVSRSPPCAVPFALIRVQKQQTTAAMFKKFGKDEISGFTQVKASVARGIRCEQQRHQHTPAHLMSLQLLRQSYVTTVQSMSLADGLLSLCCPCSQHRRAVPVPSRVRRAGCAHA